MQYFLLLLLDEVALKIGNQMKMSEIRHIGITVRDIDRSASFYSSMFGLQELSRSEAFGEHVSSGVGVVGARLNIVILAGQNTRLELVQYAQSYGKTNPPCNNDVGAAHVCFAVINIEDAYEELIAKGAQFVAPPSPPLYQNNGVRFAYLRDPDGITVEILQAPDA